MMPITNTEVDAANEAILESARNILTLEQALETAKQKHRNTLFGLLDEAARGQLGRGPAFKSAARTINDEAASQEAAASPKSPKKPRKAAAKAAKPKASESASEPARVGRKPSPDSAASKVLRAMTDRALLTYTAPELVNLTGLDLKKVQSAIGQLRHGEKIATVDRGKYKIA